MKMHPRACQFDVLRVATKRKVLKLSFLEDLRLHQKKAYRLRVLAYLGFQHIQPHFHDTTCSESTVRAGGFAIVPQRGFMGKKITRNTIFLNCSVFFFNITEPYNRKITRPYSKKKSHNLAAERKITCTDTFFVHELHCSHLQLRYVRHLPKGKGLNWLP